MTNKYPVHLALKVIDGDLLTKLPIKRLDRVTRTKAHFFEVTPSERQFAILVGDFDETRQQFDEDDTRVLLQEYPPEMEGIKRIPVERYYNGATATRKLSKLAPPGQRSVYAESETALRKLLEWYTNTPFKTGKALVSQSEANTQSNHEKITMTQNIILYGPPGTGKTFETACRAVQLCDGTFETEDRKALMARYEELRKEGRIAFITFHQSYSYEDFVEGLRPEVKDGQVKYDVRPGIFREICDAAKLSRSAEPGLKGGEPIRDRTVFKMSLGEAGSVEGRRVFQESMEAGRILLGWGGDVDFSACNSSEELRKQFIESYPNDESVESNVKYVDVFKNAVKKGDLVVASQGNRAYRAIGEVTGPYEFQEEGTFHQSRPVRWLAILDGNHPVSEIYGRNFTQSTLYELDKSVINYQALEKLIQKNAEGTSRAFVLVIDEINRANISKVFGELITLLEPDKREGSLNALTVKLPYSGKDFSVPSNLHIVGTMNTADRSIALLDTALRRRFMFEELMPEPTKITNTVPGVDLQKLLKAMNERIEALYDRDHTIGHAYLMHASSLAELNSIFRHKILPLLQEYFHEDWSRIRRVLNDLGDGVFISKAPRAPVPGEESDTYDSESRQIYQVNRTEFPAEAFRQIYEG